MWISPRTRRRPAWSSSPVTAFTPRKTRRGSTEASSARTSSARARRCQDAPLTLRPRCAGLAVLTPALRALHIGTCPTMPDFTLHQTPARPPSHHSRRSASSENPTRTRGSPPHDLSRIRSWGTAIRIPPPRTATSVTPAAQHEGLDRHHLWPRVDHNPPHPAPNTNQPTNASMDGQAHGDRARRNTERERRDTEQTGRPGTAVSVVNRGANGYQISNTNERPGTGSRAVGVDEPADPMCVHWGWRGGAARPLRTPAARASQAAVARGRPPRDLAVAGSAPTPHVASTPARVNGFAVLRSAPALRTSHRFASVSVFSLMRPSLRSERVYRAHGHPRPSTASPSSAPLRPFQGDCRSRPCRKLLRASRKAGPRSTRRSATRERRSVVAGIRFRQPCPRRGPGRNRCRHGALRKRRSAGDQQPSGGRGRDCDRGRATPGTCRG